MQTVIFWFRNWGWPPRSAGVLPCHRFQETVFRELARQSEAVFVLAEFLQWRYVVYSTQNCIVYRRKSLHVMYIVILVVFSMSWLF
jgi:hypothetical protein